MTLVHIAGGLCCAIVLALVFILELQLFFYKELRVVIHLGECSLLIIFALGLSFATLQRTTSLKFTANVITEGVDEQLLYVTYFANVLFDAILIISLGSVYPNLSDDYKRYLVGFRIVYAILDLAEVSFQTYVIQDSFYRCGDRATEKKKRWSQTLLGFLLSVNLSMWMILSFQVSSIFSCSLALIIDTVCNTLLFVVSNLAYRIWYQTQMHTHIFTITFRPKLV